MYLLSMCVCMFVCILGGGEVWAHAQCLKARIWHFENVTRIPETEKKKNNKKNKERKECDEQTRMLWEVRDLETVEDRAVLSEWETGWNIKDAAFLHCTTLQQLGSGSKGISS